MNPTPNNNGTIASTPLATTSNYVRPVYPARGPIICPAPAPNAALVRPPATPTPQPTPRDISPQKLAANRLNARKSTGPRTAAGKYAVRLNAARFNHLAKIVLPLGPKAESLESQRDFKKLCRDLYAELNPVGAFESLLADQIVSTTWRLQRLHRAESAGIGLNLAQINEPEPLEKVRNEISAAALGPSETPLIERLRKSVSGCEFLMSQFTCVLWDVKKAGELTEATLQYFKQVFRAHAESPADRLEHLRNVYLKNPDNLSPEALKDRHLGSVMEYLEDEIEECKKRLPQLQFAEEARQANRLAAAALPDKTSLDRLLKYETALERQRSNALSELRSLQQTRLSQGKSMVEEET